MVGDIFPITLNNNGSALAHATISLSIRPPALTRHVTFVYPEEELSSNSMYSPHDGGDYVVLASRETVRGKIIEILECFTSKMITIDSRAVKDRFDRAFANGDSFSENMTARGLGRFLTLEIRVVIDLHADYGTMTIVLDNDLRSKPRFAEIVAAWNKVRMRAAAGERVGTDGNIVTSPKERTPSDMFAGQPEITGEKAAAWITHEMSADESRRQRRSTDKLPPSPPHDPKRTSEEGAEVDVRTVYFDVWRKFDHKFGLGTLFQTLSPNLTHRQEKRGEFLLIADFRGFINCPSGRPIRKEDGPGWPSSGAAPAEPDLRAKPLRFIPKAMSLSPDRQSLFQFLTDHPAFPMATLGLDETGRPFDADLVGLRSEPNSVLCTMLSGDAIYCSTFSSRTSLPRSVRSIYEQNENLIVPVRFMVLYGGNSADQLGRLIRRLHSLGEVRNAGLLDYGKIVGIGRSLQSLGTEISQAIDYCVRKPKVFRRKTLEELTAEYVRLGRGCHGGLAYRTIRSQFYYNLIQSSVKDVYAAEIPGWQSYEGFLRRNFERRFRTIQSVGERYRDIGTRLDRLISLSDTARQYTFAYVTLFVSLGALLFLGENFMYSRVMEFAQEQKWSSHTNHLVIPVFFILYFLVMFVLSLLLLPLNGRLALVRAWAKDYFLW